MTITQGVTHNKLKKLRSKRAELVTAFNRASANHRDISGMYIAGRHRGADYLLAEIEKVDAQIKHWEKYR